MELLVAGAHHASANMTDAAMDAQKGNNNISCADNSTQFSSVHSEHHHGCHGVKNLKSDAYMVFGVFLLVLLIVFMYYFKQALVRLRKNARTSEHHANSGCATSPSSQVFIRDDMPPPYSIEMFYPSDSPPPYHIAVQMEHPEDSKTIHI